MVIVFDLDHTLYDDVDFVLGGFKAVAQFLSHRLDFKERSVFNELKGLFRINRNCVFDRFLTIHNCYSKKLLNKCVSVYRGHTPSLQLYPQAKKILCQLQSTPMYVVTDGNKVVQKRKYEALKIAPFFKKCLCTGAYGNKHAKPSPYCFLKICEWEDVAPSEVVYIADNPTKDFIGIKPLGFRTIRVLTGPHNRLIVPPEYEADFVISNLNELSDCLKKL